MTSFVAPDLAARLADTACVNGTFTLPDGRVLDAYFDEFRLAADPRLLRDIAVAMRTLVPAGAEVLAGVALGGVPLTVALSAATGLPAAFVRHRVKHYGSKRQIEGTDIGGKQVVLVDDVVRTGSQLLTAARMLRITGARVTDALCLLERPLGGRRSLSEYRITLAPLLGEADLPAPATEAIS
ncbi:MULTISPECIES: orotate phosphoribosyltransferase [Streptomyces]|uniref:orotate phosphoribosyltransferase n=1 Tax=Streptomyces TaxID=1883 RepID=UPI0004C6CA13|nr:MULTISPECIES: phosphoribosyltransferase family protein [Streptomyces]MDI6412274.1 phosphoribosyltransferase family protein [Streptomyces albus]